MGLAFDYGRTPARVMETFWFYVAWTIPVALFLIVRFRIRHAMTKVSLVIFFAGLLPVLGFVAFGFQDISTVADRYLYLPMLGVSLIVAAMLSRIQHAVKIPGIVVCLLLLAILSGRQARYWQDNSSLYARGLAVNPQSFVACNNLGNLLLKKNQLDQAAAMFSRALVIKPSHATSHYNLGLALTRNGQPEAAIREFRQGITILQVRGMAVKAEMYFDLAVSLEKIGRLDDAETQYRNALDAAPAMARARLGLGNVYYAMGNADSAGTQFRRALKAQPDFTAAKIRLADMLLIEKAYPEAIQLYNSALQERPEDMPRIQLNLGIVFSLMGQLDDAVAQLDDAHAMLERERNSEMASQLARAWFELSDQLHFQGDVTEAIACLQKALRLVPADSVPAHEIQKRATEFATPDQPRKQ
jgi:protein O-mannosyl-transferase